MRFSDHQSGTMNSYSPRRLDFLMAGAGHVLLLLIAAVTFSDGSTVLTGGEDAIMVRMVTTGASETLQGEVSVPEEVQEEVVVPEEVQEEAVIPEETQETPEEVQEEIVVPEEVQENPEEVQEEIPEETVQENPEEVQEENPAESGGFVSVSSQGDAGAGAPGPGTYESRVFNAVRRGYRTSVTPQQSYRIILTVLPNGTTQVEVVRKSGTAAFDRAVENALSMAQIPPMPPGRTAPAVINIEFLGPE